MKLIWERAWEESLFLKKLRRKKGAKSRTVLKEGKSEPWDLSVVHNSYFKKSGGTFCAVCYEPKDQLSPFFQRGGTIRIIGARRLHCPAKDATSPVNQAVCFRALTVTLIAIGLRPSKESSPEVRLCFQKLFSELLRLFWYLLHKGESTLAQ